MEALTEVLKVIHEGSLKNDRELLKLIEAVIDKLDKLEKRVNSLDRETFDELNERIRKEMKREEYD